MECIWHTFGTQIGDQDQAQDEDRVQAQVTIEDLLVERKGLKEVERKGLKEARIKIIHQVEFIIWINQAKEIQVSIKDGSWREITSP